MRNLLQVLVGVACLAMLANAEAQRFLNCKETAKNADDCKVEDYAMRIAYMIAPAYVVGVLLLIVGPYWTLCRACSCCGCGKVPADGLSSCDVFRPKVYMLICIAGIAATGIVNDLASDKMVKGVLDLFDVIEKVPEVIGAEITMINNSLIVTRYNSDTDQDYQDNLFESGGLGGSMTKIRDDMKKSLEGQLDSVREYVEYAGMAFLLIYSIPIGLVLIAGLAALCNCRNCIPGCVSFFMFFFNFLFWILYGVALIFALVVGDITAEVTAINTGKLSILPAVAGCDTSQFDSFRTEFNNIEMSTSKSACESLRDLCYQTSRSAIDNAAASRIYDCERTPYPDCNKVDFADMVTLLDSGISIHDNVKALPNAKNDGFVCQELTPCTPQQCGDDCTFANKTRSKAGRNSREMYMSFKAAETVSISLDTLGGRYGSCESMFAIMLRPFQGPCDKIVENAFVMYDATGFGCVIAMMTIITLIYGQSRFMSFSEAAATRKKTEEVSDEAVKEPYDE